MTSPYSPNNPFNKTSSDHDISGINNINEQDIDAVFESHPDTTTTTTTTTTTPPSIHIETPPNSSTSQFPEQQQREETPPPRLPSRPVSPALPPRPTTLQPANNDDNHLSTDNIPSPAYTPVASPNETIVPSQPNSEIPSLNLSTTEDEHPPPLPPPPPYSEAPQKLQNQIFTPPFSNTGGDTNHYQRPPHPPPAPQMASYQRPPGPPPPQRRRPGGGYPGNSHATYGNAAYNSNQPPLPPRR